MEEPVFTSYLRAQLPNGTRWPLELTTTAHNWKGDGPCPPPTLTCLCCREQRSLMDMLGYTGSQYIKTNTGTYLYGIIGLMPACHYCQPTREVPLHFCHEGKLRMRMAKILDENDMPLRVRMEDTNEREEKVFPWVTVDKFQLRLMWRPTKANARKYGDRLSIRMQPKFDRRSEKDKKAARKAFLKNEERRGNQLEFSYSKPTNG